MVFRAHQIFTFDMGDISIRTELSSFHLVAIIIAIAI